ncbi:S-layer homology domain-containing protein [Paenibacillus provencensis]|uniref:S-layer homology domain-containing protein n=1 Tax=Paenibacillus provencensis TaxID=441151 RepID=A0ABW3PYR2_9BACL|nr:S-layer homology domain-containing protein [Paenibacillus sp. MER 78]MCM3127985.1 S-layer homology domain-containing protein [Paenibacillus sp. MER 78]
MSKRTRRPLKVWSLVLVITILAGLWNPSMYTAYASPEGNQIVISQVYGGGGNSGATYTHDFIELYNPTGEAVDLTGYTVKYASATGDFGTIIPTELNGAIRPYSYYLIQQAKGNGGTAALPAPDQTGAINLSGTNGKVGLFLGEELVDLIGYGNANEYEGSTAAPVLTNSTAAVRLAAPGADPGSRGLDTDNNAEDFSVASPDPRNSSYGQPETKTAEVTVSPEQGAYPQGTEIHLSSATAGASVYADVYGSDGVSSGYQLVNGPILLNEPLTIHTYAEKDGLERSETSIYSYDLLPQMTIAEARLAAQGEQVMISGIVTHVNGSKMYVQDETAAIVLYGFPSFAQAGDRVRVSGVMDIYNNLQEIAPSQGLPYTLVENNVGVPSPVQVTGADLASDSGEQHEAKLVYLENVYIREKSGSSWIAEQGGNEFTIYSNLPGLAAGKSFDKMIGVIEQYRDVYQLIPLNEQSLIEDLLSVHASPAEGKIVIGQQVTLSSPTAGADIYYTLDGSDPTTSSTHYEAPITIHVDTVIKVMAVSGSDTSEVYTFSYEATEQPRIHDIQGAGHTSPYLDQHVSDIEGVVTQLGYRFSDGSYQGFYIQDLEPDDDPDTSESIYVYSTNLDLKPEVEDIVTISGTVAEYNEGSSSNLTTTQIVPTSIIKVGETGLPAPILLGKNGRVIPSDVIDNDGFTVFDPEEDAIDFYESLEGMRVVLPSPTVISPTWTSSQIVNIPTRIDNGEAEVLTPAGGLVLKQEGNLNPQRLLIASMALNQDVRTGNQFAGDVTGVIGYNAGNFKVMPAKDALPALLPSSYGQETTEIVPDEDQLIVASYNIENFYPGVGSSKITKLAASITSNMKLPDIIGLVEVQDHNGQTDNGIVEADDSYQVLIDAIIANGGPEYAFTDIAPVNNEDGGAPGGNIRVGFLYNPERVTLADSIEERKGSSTEAVTYDANQDQLSVNPGRIEPQHDAFLESRKPLAAQFEFNGEKVIVIANHFNSKSGDNGPFGNVQPPVLTSEAQRHEIAAVVNGFVKDIIQGNEALNKEANVIVLGDLNDFQFTETADILRGDELDNLIDTLPAGERYTYTYDGNSQVLDHILVSKNLTEHTQTDVIHLNADFTEASGRVSDHDPVMAQIDILAAGSEETPGNPDPGTDPGTDSGNPPSSGTNPPVDNPKPIQPPEAEHGTITVEGVLNTTSEMRIAEGVVTGEQITSALSGMQDGVLRIKLDMDEDYDSAQISLVPEAVELLLQHKANLTIQISVSFGSYELPIEEIDLSQIRAELGAGAGEFELRFALTKDRAAIELASLKGYSPLAAVNYSVAAYSAEGQVYELTEFDQYIRRTITLTSYELSKLEHMAAVRAQDEVNADRLHPVPFQISGNEAEIFSRSNSTYLLLEHHVTFGDMNDHWARSNVEQLADKMIVSGTAAGVYDPNTAITRAEYAALLVRALGLAVTPEAMIYSDVPNSAWYAHSIQSAANAGLITGYSDGTFRPNQQVTREEIAAMTYRAMQFAAYEPTSSDRSLTYLDNEMVHDWAKEAVEELSRLGVLYGDRTDHFDPSRSATRAESAAVVNRMLDLLVYTQS